MGCAQAAADEEQVRFGAERETQSRLEALRVVGHLNHAQDLDAARAEVGAQKGAVRILRAAVQQLVAAEDYGGGGHR